jgi:aminopeptidase
MMDPRLDELARVLVCYSVGLKKGEKILIEAIGADRAAVVALVKAVQARGGVPFVCLKDPVVDRALLRGATLEGIKTAGASENFLMKKMDAYVGLRSGNNIFELSDVPGDKMDLYAAHWWKPVHLKTRCLKTKWVVLRYPNDSMAQQAGLSTEAFVDFYFDVCTLDYKALSRAMTPLERRMKKAKEVHIKGPGTDLRFSLKGIGAAKCDGKYNIPDGEVVSVPVIDSVQGVVTFNAPSLFEGVIFENVRLLFEKGKVVEATCNETKRFNQILDRDQGARFLGEFALGVNPRVTKPMKDTLFDEKIAGSFHLALGDSVNEGDVDNGNRSQIHWDIVSIQKPAWGGGEIYFDGKLIRKNGRFAPADLKPLDRLK